MINKPLSKLVRKLFKPIIIEKFNVKNYRNDSIAPNSTLRIVNLTEGSKCSVRGRNYLAYGTCNVELTVTLTKEYSDRLSRAWDKEYARRRLFKSIRHEFCYTHEKLVADRLNMINVKYYNIKISKIIVIKPQS
jgi:hypothetical protein